MRKISFVFAALALLFATAFIPASAEDNGGSYAGNTDTTITNPVVAGIDENNPSNSADPANPSVANQTLPVTGTNTRSIAQIGVVVILAGAVVLASARRSNTKTA